MVVRHNISALNAQRNLGVNNSMTAKNLEKLSSGLRINRSADDAAGLAISEKMRGQVRGLGMAEQNVSNAEQLIQTAEGGLHEVHDLLHRMRELAVQSANGTYDNDVDRYNLNKELEALKGEIDRIAQSTHYNGINLLDGTLGAEGIAQLAGGVFDNGLTSLPCESGSYYALAEKLRLVGFPVREEPVDTKYINTFQFTSLSNGLLGGTADLIINHGVDENDNPTAFLALKVGDTIYQATVENNTYEFRSSSGEVVAVLDCQVSGVKTLFDTGVSGVITNIDLSTDPTVLLDKNTNYMAGAAVPDTHPLYNSRFGDETSAAAFQIGANGTKDQRALLSVLNMNTISLGTLQATAHNDTGSIHGVSVATQDAANDAISIIDAAVNQVSSVRADLGSLQNRLEHTMNNLGVTKENLTAAESTIRDADMAEEMMEFTKNSILSQAAQAMLAQAQQLPQGVLQLLQ